MKAVESTEAKEKSIKRMKIDEELFEQIQRRLPPESEIRLKQLRAERQAETLSESEHIELLALLDAVEQQDALRIKALNQLAERTGRDLADLAKEFGIGSARSSICSDSLWWSENSPRLVVEENRGKYIAVVNKETFFGNTYQEAKKKETATTTGFCCKE